MKYIFATNRMAFMKKSKITSAVEAVEKTEHLRIIDYRKLYGGPSEC